VSRTPSWLLIGLIGPVVALLVTWLPPLAICHVGARNQATQRHVEQLRHAPTDTVLANLRSFAVPAGGFSGLSVAETVRAADGVLHGRLELPRLSHLVDVPFNPDGDVFGTMGWHLQLCSLIVPNLLARAYSVTGDNRFLEAAVKYVLDWSRFESALRLPRGYIFNDHAVAARAIVVTEVWHQYRASAIYRPEIGVELVAYAQRTASLLRKPELYTYRTNHGLMQSLSLLHLAIAFPQLPDANLNRVVGTQRFLAQISYYINEEGVVLENSAGYHEHGLDMLAAGLRYFALLGVPVPADLQARFQKGLRFYAALRRPDSTLPPLGDTEDDPSDVPDVAALGYGSAVSARPEPLALAPAAGYAVLWQGLDLWPEVATLSQVVMNWSNFPTRVHKHADDLGLSLWTGGVQWITSVGYWPYDAGQGRERAIGWRGSSAPHWVGENVEVERSNTLLSAVRAERTVYLDVSRVNADGSSARRHFVQIGRRTWATIDSFDSSRPRGAEIVWHFGPGTVLGMQGPDRFLLKKTGSPLVMIMNFGGSAGWTAEADASGAATWNSGVYSAGRITRSPAIRLTASGKAPVLLSVFELRDSASTDRGAGAVDLKWHGPEQWGVSISGPDAGQTVLKRTGQRFSVIEAGSKQESWALSPEPDRAEADAADRFARAALEDATGRYGHRFEPMLERRTKVTAAIVACGAFQLLLFALVRRKVLWRMIFSTSAVCWIALATFLHLRFLV